MLSEEWQRKLKNKERQSPEKRWIGKIILKSANFWNIGASTIHTILDFYALLLDMFLLKSDWTILSYNSLNHKINLIFVSFIS